MLIALERNLLCRVHTFDISGGRQDENNCFYINVMLESPIKLRINAIVFQG